MKKLSFLFSCLTLLSVGASSLEAQGTGFTYQGQLKQQGAPVDGLNDVTFTLFDLPSGGNPIGNPFAVNDLVVSNGLFAVTLDFGVGAFNGAPRWLQIDLRPGQSVGAFTPLSPRQPLTPAPYAIFAGGAAASGLTGKISGTQIADGTITPSQLGSSIGWWNRSGNDIAYGAGNVNIGAPTSPTTLGYPFDWKSLYLNNSSGPGLAIVEGASFARLSLRNSAASVNNRNLALDFGNNQFNVRWLKDDLGVRVDGLTLDAAGFLGVGSTAPKERLTVEGNALVSGKLVLGTLGTSRLGIGTNAPATAMHIVSSSDTELSLESAANHRRWTFQASGGTDGVGLGGSFQIIDRTAVAARMVITTNGNIGIGTGAPGTKLEVAGEVTMTACNITSDRNAKEGFKPVDTLEVLNKLTRIPITEWQYKTQGDVRHIGPMAQDFRDAFALGRDEKHITTVDADGVALAAIQGLNQLVQDQRRALDELREKNLRLEQRLAERLSALEKQVSEGRAPAGTLQSSQE